MNVSYVFKLKHSAPDTVLHFIAGKTNVQGEVKKINVAIDHHYKPQDMLNVHDSKLKILSICFI